MPAAHEVVIEAAEAGQRLDRHLRKLLPRTPLSAIFKLLRQGRIRVDGGKAEPSLRLAAGMRLLLRVAEADLAQAPPARAGAPPFDGDEPTVLFEDADLLVIDKPSGMAAQPGSGARGDVTAWLAARRAHLATATFKPAPAHRLDRETSGVLCIGNSPRGLRALHERFRAGDLHRHYLAIVTGTPPPSGVIEAPLLVHEQARSTQAKVRVDAAGQPAHTRFERHWQRGGRAMVALWPATGRMHQLRVHLKHIGCPIVGDRRYGGAPAPRLLLHAHELELVHPFTGAPLRLRAPLPPGFD